MYKQDAFVTYGITAVIEWSCLGSGWSGRRREFRAACAEEWFATHLDWKFAVLDAHLNVHHRQGWCCPTPEECPAHSRYSQLPGRRWPRWRCLRRLRAQGELLVMVENLLEHYWLCLLAWCHGLETGFEAPASGLYSGGWPDLDASTWLKQAPFWRAFW